MRSTTEGAPATVGSGPRAVPGPVTDRGPRTVGDRVLAAAFAPAGLLVDGAVLLVASAWLIGASPSAVPGWWPQAAITVLALAWAPPTRRAVTTATVAVALIGGALLAGRPTALAVGLGLSAALSAVGVAWVLVWRRGPQARPRLTTLGDVGRLVWATQLGALVAGLGAAAAGWLSGTLDPVAAFGIAAPAHGAAILLLVPLGLRMPHGHSPAGRAESVALVVASWGLTGALFWPGHAGPLVFLTTPLVVWAASRVPPRWVAGLLIGLGLVAGWCTVAGGGPFAAYYGAGPAALALTQAYVLVSALVALPLSLSVEARRASLDQLRASERLFRSGFDDSLLGMLLLRRCRPGHADHGDPDRGDPDDAWPRPGSAEPSPAALLPPGHDGRGLDVVELNDVAARMFGRSAALVRGASWTRVVPAAQRGRLVAALDAMTAGEIPGWHGELLLETAAGARWVEVAISPMDTSAAEQLFAVQVVDVTARREAEQRLVAQATTDALTGLANRATLHTRIDAALAADGGAVLLELDLDNFKHVNDSAGDPVGDGVLVATAQRIAAMVRPGDLPARLGGDEFVVLCRPWTAVADAEALAGELLAGLDAPIQVGGTQVRPSASVGIAAVGPDGDADALLRDADAAMYAAKAAGKGRVVVFTAEHRARAERALRLETQLRDALDHDELEVHYQPVVELAGGGLVAAEALVRWRHPERGLLGPGDWLDVAESCGLMPRLGAWVLGTACAEASRWPARVTVQVNVSARQLEVPGFVDQVATALGDSGLDPTRLVLEFTETQLDEVTAAVAADLAALRTLGVGLAADDFGTGYSPLTRIIDLPLTMVKVDRRFVADLDDPRNLAVVRALLHLSAALGLTTVAEGIERPEQARLLREMGADHGQGYHYGRPMPAVELAALVSRPASGSVPSVSRPASGSVPAVSRPASGSVPAVSRPASGSVPSVSRPASGSVPSVSRPASG